jgi:hypothetical protein
MDGTLRWLKRGDVRGESAPRLPGERPGEHGGEGISEEAGMVNKSEFG